MNKKHTDKIYVVYSAHIFYATNTYLLYNGLFSGFPHLTGSCMVFFPHLFQEKTFWDMWHRVFLYRSDDLPVPIFGIKALKGTESTELNQWLGPILFLSTTRFLKEGSIAHFMSTLYSKTPNTELKI